MFSCRATLNERSNRSGCGFVGVQKTGVFLILLLAAGKLSAAPVVLQKLFDPVTGGMRDDFTGILGGVFKATWVSNRVVTHLGYYDQNGEGLQRSHSVGIFSASPAGSGIGALLAQVAIPAGTGGILENNYRWMPLATPLTLTNNASYVLAAEVFNASGDAYPDWAVQVWNGYFAGTNFAPAGQARWSASAWPHEPQNQLVTASASYGAANLGFAGGGTPWRILCVGDSITAGYTDNTNWTVPFQFGYRSGLAARMKIARIPFLFVGHCPEPWNGVWRVPTNTPSPDLRLEGQDHHEGHGGMGTAYVAQNLTNWISQTDPEIVLLMIGINDIPAGSTGTSGAAQTNLYNIVQTIVGMSPQTRIIVAQITSTTTVTSAIAEYNAYIQHTLVPAFAAQGKWVYTVDQYSNFLLNGGPAINKSLYSNGWNHPNAAGYDLMAQTWYDGIRAALASTATPLDRSPGKLTAGLAGSGFTLSWPAEQTGWQLETQTKLSGTGLNTNWHLLAGSATTNVWSVSRGSNVSAAFYRLVFQ